MALTLVVLVGLAFPILAGTQQISVKEGWPDIIDGSKPCYVSHSWNIPVWYPERNRVKAAWDALQSAGLDIKLYIDGDELPCDRIAPRLVPGDSPPDEAAWQFSWGWRFPPNYFEEGVHVFVIDYIAPWGSPVELAVEVVY